MLAAVGDCGDVVALGCFRRWGWSLWPFVAICFHGRSLFVVVVVGGHRGSPCVQSLLVVVCVDGGGKQKRSQNKHCLLFITNT